MRSVFVTCVMSENHLKLHINDRIDIFVFSQSKHNFKKFLKSSPVVPRGIDMVSVVRNEIYLFYVLIEMFQKAYAKTHNNVLLKHACDGRTRNFENCVPEIYEI